MKMKKIMFLMALISVISNAEITVTNSKNTKNISTSTKSIDDMTVSGDGAYKNDGDPKDMDYMKFLKIVKIIEYILKVNYKLMK